MSYQSCMGLFYRLIDEGTTRYKCFRCKGKGRIFKNRIGCWLCQGFNQASGIGLCTTEEKTKYNKNKNNFLCYK